MTYGTNDPILGVIRINVWILDYITHICVQHVSELSIEEEESRQSIHWTEFSYAEMQILWKGAS